MPLPLPSRRQFLRQLLGTGALAVAGLPSLASSLVPPRTGPSFRLAFLTDFHLMKDGNLGSAHGIAACLTALEKLNPRPELIIAGGDLVNASRDLTIPEAEQRLNLFLQIWHDHTALPVHWVFGNHDLVGLTNDQASPSDPLYGKGLFEQRFQLHPLYNSFDYQGWHFVMLDDIGPETALSYYSGHLFDEDLRFLRADLDAHRAMPTIICTHIPIVSNLAIATHFLAAIGIDLTDHTLICNNGGALTADLPGHNVRAVLAGHLHRYERLTLDGIPYYNSGAVCGDYWRGPMFDCPAGYAILDLAADGSLAFDYRAYA
jgi:Icc protein